MKQLILTLSLVAFSQLLNAQTDLYFKIRKLINETHPEVSLDNRLIAYNTWSVDDAESREANRNFEKAYKTYEYARLKGGFKGLIVITVNKDNLSSMATITLNKDGVVKSLSYKAETLKDLPNKNMVFDANGAVVYKDLPASTVFTSINQLITR